MRKFLSLLLVLALCLSLSAAALASSEEPAASSDNTTVFPDVYPEDALVIYDDEELDTIINAIINTMTLEEKLEFVSGDSADTTPLGYGTGAWLGLARLGIPVMRSYDGPMGVISKSGVETTKPASEIALAASWNIDMAYAYGALCGEENKSMAGSMQLGAQLDNARDLFFGRTRDTFGEDWFLTGSIGAAEAEGIQSENVIAVLKHFSGYVDNSNPGTPSYTYVDEQTLHENMLSGFEMAVKDGGALSIMSSYNRIDGEWYLNDNVIETQAASNSYLQITVARDMWNWNGMFVTDWGGNQQYSTNKGTDMETPSAANNSAASIEMSMEAGETTLEQVEDAIYHILWAVGKIGYLGLVELSDDGRTVKEEPGRTEPIELPAMDDIDERLEMLAENYETALQSAEEGAVLLKNDNDALPLSEDSGSIALIGESMAYTFMGHYSESSQGALTGTTTPYESLCEILGDEQVDVYAAIDEFGETVPAANLYVDEAATENGVLRTDAATGETVTDEQLSYLTNSKTYFNAEDGNAFEQGSEYTIETYLVVDESGTYDLLLGGIGGTTEAYITIDGEEVELAASTSSDFPTSSAVYTSTGVNFSAGSLYEPVDETASDEAETAEDDPTNGGEFGDFGGMAAFFNFGPSGYSRFELEAGVAYKITIHATADSEWKDMQLVLNWKTPGYDDDIYAEALEAAASYDTVVVSVYHRETNDTLSLDDSAQEAMLMDVIAAAKAAGNRVIVVGYLALPIDVTDWIDDVDAFLCMWLPGQASGQATAELLTGVVNPSGKLPVAWPMSAEDAQTDGLPETGTEIDIEEGIFMGYRWYDSADIAPRWDFGYGLSYTTFEYSDLEITEAADGIDEYGYDVTFTITNTGDVAGAEVAEVYLGAAEVPENIQMAMYQLAGFTKVTLEPGESQTVTVHIDQRSLSYWDINLGSDELYQRADGTSDKWTVATGNRNIYVGSAEDNLILCQTVTVG